MRNLRSVKNHVQITRWLLDDLSSWWIFFSVTVVSARKALKLSWNVHYGWKLLSGSRDKWRRRTQVIHRSCNYASKDRRVTHEIFVLLSLRTTMVHFVIVVRSWNNSTLRLTGANERRMSRVSRRKLSQNAFFCFLLPLHNSRVAVT